MKIRDLINNTFRSYRKNWFWSVFLSLIFSTIFLLLVNFLLLFSNMDVFYKSIIYLDDNNAKFLEMFNISQDLKNEVDLANYTDPSELDDYKKEFMTNLLNTKQAGIIKQFGNKWIKEYKEEPGYTELAKFDSFNNVVILSGKYLDFANIKDDFSNMQNYAYVSEDLASLVGTDFKFRDLTFPIKSTVNYSYPIDTDQYSFSIDSKDYQEDFHGYDSKTLFLVSNSIDTLEKISFDRLILEDFIIFNPSDELLYDFNSYYNKRSGDVGLFVNMAENLTRFMDYNPMKQRIDATVTLIGVTIIFLLLLINIFQNLKDQEVEFRIHLQFGADDSFIFSWMYLYIFVYLFPSLVLTPLFLYFALPSVLTLGRLILFFLLYILFTGIIAFLAFIRFKKDVKY